METILIAIQIEDEDKQMPSIRSVKMQRIKQDWNLTDGVELQTYTVPSGIGGGAVWHIKTTSNWQLALDLSDMD